MSEWLKVVLGTCSGLVVGLVGALVLEPLKQHIMLRYKATKADRAVYDELGKFYNCINAFAGDVKLCAGLVEVAGFEVFDYYYEQQRDAFYLLPDHYGIRSLYRQLRRILVLARRGRQKPTDAVCHMIRTFEFSISLGHVDGDRIKRISAQFEAETREQLEKSLSVFNWCQ